MINEIKTTDKSFKSLIDECTKLNQRGDVKNLTVTSSTINPNNGENIYVIYVNGVYHCSINDCM